MDCEVVASTEFIPFCDEKLKPKVGMNFYNYEEAYNFYKVYAEASGFDIRKGTKQRDTKDHSVVIRRYVYCNREGNHKVVSVVKELGSSTQERGRASARCGCLARISLIFDPSYGVRIERFTEGHSHELVTPQYRRFLKANRKLGYMEKTFCDNCAKVNIGPISAYRFYKETVGDYSSVGSLANDWKNYARDRRAFVEGCDAQLLLQKMKLKKESCPAFFYSYTVDNDDRLRCLFWADPIARRNYSVFGDVVSFDCTYKTNRYDLIFAPFTGKDNHGKLVTFAAALIPAEDHTVYEWVFKIFKECMIRAPLLMITDQDPAMKVAMEVVLPETKHRLCMWHIMMKVPLNISAEVRNHPNFKLQMSSTVWNTTMTIADFEEQWSKLMVDFQLSNDKWFCSIYDIRYFWLPAYFRDVPMSGICRTTSISESMNNFFKNYLNSRSNLVEFIMHFESAMDAQRQTNDMMNCLDKSSPVIMKTPFLFEKHAYDVYTRSIFITVQKEIMLALHNCSTKNVNNLEKTTTYEVEDGSEVSWLVSYSKVDQSVHCTCDKFVRDGLLCSHIFSVFKQLKWKVIPDKYIVWRWTKAAYSHPMIDIGDCPVEGGFVLDDKKKKTNATVARFYECLGIVEGDDDNADKLMEGICNMLSEFKLDAPVSPKQSNDNQRFEDFYGTSRPDVVEVLPPMHVSTKGSCSRKKSRIEAVAAKAARPKRLCKMCGEYGHHDSRNCPTRKL